MDEIDRYYEILELEPGASPEEVKRAYRDLAKVWHPDRFPNDPRLQLRAQEKLKEINEAYEQLQSGRPGPRTRESGTEPRYQQSRPSSESGERGGDHAQAPPGAGTTEQQQRRQTPPWKCVCGIVHSGDQLRCWNCGRSRSGGFGQPRGEGDQPGAGWSKPGVGETTAGPQTSQRAEDSGPKDSWECGCGVTNARWRRRCSGCRLEYAEAMRRTRQADEGVSAYDDRQYSQIGGWLILVGIGLVLYPLRMLVFIGSDLLPAFSPGTWSILTTPGTELYHPLWAPLLIFELVGNILLIGFSIVAAVYFFNKRRLLPKMMVTLLIGSSIFVAADYFLADLIPFVRGQNGLESARELTRAAIACMIWVPYFLVSKRVKGTFVH